MGAWTFIEPRLREMGYDVKYVGRDISASPATGSRQILLLAQMELVQAALAGEVPHLVRATGAAGRPQRAAEGDGKAEGTSRAAAAVQR